MGKPVYFINKKYSAICFFYQTHLIRICTGKSTFYMSKEL